MATTMINVRRRPSLSLRENLMQDNRMVVLAVAGSIDEGQRAGVRHRSQLFQQRRFARQLAAIATGEFFPACRLMAEPATQFVAWCNILRPAIDRRSRFAQAARPQPVNQNANPVFRCRRLVGPLQADVGGIKSRRHDASPLPKSCRTRPFQTVRAGRALGRR